MMFAARHQKRLLQHRMGAVGLGMRSTQAGERDLRCDAKIRADRLGEMASAQAPKGGWWSWLASPTQLCNAFLEATGCTMIQHSAGHASPQVDGDGGRLPAPTRLPCQAAKHYLPSLQAWPRLANTFVQSRHLL